MFEFDPSKSKANKIKHGIDFEESIKLWNDPNRIIIKARTIDEQRFMMIAELNGAIWSTIYTVRSDSKRIISVRRSRENEKEIYYSG
ncbi:BrnT family toxin [Algoriphagus formosus]|uniref:BrnT family toxin n=1 Tax=Algoriphagus formosus TaxID=2007308 RepID=UPI000C29448F|nr:BrnT family toxin [Algoriphagus formosus]